MSNPAKLAKKAASDFMERNPERVCFVAGALGSDQ